MLKKYLVVLSNSDKFQVLKSINQFKGARVNDVNIFGTEMALLITVFENEEEFLRIISKANRIVGEELIKVG